MEKKRSAGVTIFARIILVLSALTIIKATLGLLISFVNSEWALQFCERAYNLGRSTTLFTLAEYRRDLLLDLPFAIPLFISANAILKLKEWGRKLLVIMMIIGVGYIFFHVTAKNTLDIVSVLSIAYSILVICFFTRPKVKEQFR